MIALSVTLIIDTSLVKINDLVQKYFIPVQTKLILFSVNSTTCILLQFIVMKFVMNSFGSYRLRNSLKTTAVYLISLTSLLVLAVMVCYLVFQQFNYQYYETWINVLIVTMSYGPSSILIAWMALLFLHWYKSSHDLMVFLYFISISLISIHLIITLIFIDSKLNETQIRVHEFIGASGDVSAARHAFLDSVYRISSLLSFFSIWITTAMLLYSYREA